jgi:signal peptidase I
MGFWKRRRLLRESKALERETRRILRKRGWRIEPQIAKQVGAHADQLHEAMRLRDWQRIAAEQAALQALSDKHLAFARKSTLREYAESVGTAVLIALLLRSFVVEAFKIPSGSMIPTLLIGDFILVNKYTYGIRLPVINLKIVDLNRPKRGDVMVFRYPADPSLDYIKRVVGLPGDRLEYRNKRLTINGVPAPQRQIGDYESRERLQYIPRYLEAFDGAEHEILLEKETPGYVSRAMDFRHSGNCDYNSGGLVCTVPAGHYFVMGDNRDNSSDSRVWGFVPDENIVGKAFFIWLNLNELGRFGTFR